MRWIRDAKYLPQIARNLDAGGRDGGDALGAGKFPLVLGGDHSIAVGTVSGASRHFHQRGEGLGLIWIDAHTDMNTPDSSPSGNVHGMPLACCIGQGPTELTNIFGYSPKVNPANVALVGIRSRGRPGARHCAAFRGSCFYHARHRRAGNAGGDLRKPSASPATEPPDSLFRSTWTPWIRGRRRELARRCEGGITYREAHLAMEMIGDTGRITSMEVVEVNPVMDEANRTAILAVELVMSAMGKRIL